MVSPVGPSELIQLILSAVPNSDSLIYTYKHGLYTSKNNWGYVFFFMCMAHWAQTGQLKHCTAPQDFCSSVLCMWCTELFLKSKWNVYIASSCEVPCYDLWFFAAKHDVIFNRNHRRPIKSILGCHFHKCYTFTYVLFFYNICGKSVRNNSVHRVRELCKPLGFMKR